MEVLTGGLAGGASSPPVFSHEQEAKMFLRLREAGSDGREAREGTVGVIVSVLWGPCASVEWVALDPLPEMLFERTVGLVSTSRERFVDLVLSREQLLARRKG